MKIAVMTGLLTERDMYIDTCQVVCDLMNIFIARGTG
jgi:hypothetical protein